MIVQMFGCQIGGKRPCKIVSAAFEVHFRDVVVFRTTASGFGIGDRISHKKFGKGTILGLAGALLEIDFDEFGTKRVQANFVKSPK